LAGQGARGGADTSRPELALAADGPRRRPLPTAHPARRSLPGIPAPASAEGVPGEYPASPGARGHRFRSLLAPSDQWLLGRWLRPECRRGRYLGPKLACVLVYSLYRRSAFRAEHPVRLRTG